MPKNNTLIHLLHAHKRKIFIVGAVVALLTAGFVVYAALVPSAAVDSNESGSIERQYRQDAADLMEAVDALAILLDESRSYSDADTTQKHFDDYATALENAKTPCDNIVSRYASHSPEVLPDELADAASNSRSVCNDALLVFNYATTISEALTPYMSYDEAKLTDIQNLASFINASQSSIDTLKSIENPGIEDPGRQELIVQIENTRDIATGKLNDHNRGTSVDTSQLVERVRSDKQHLLNARAYFWNNTVMLNRLQAITERIHAEY